MKNKIVEMDLLEVLEKESIISQRKLSEKTGVSLGMINLLIKKCVKKGFIKVEMLNSRTVKYILTTKGINEKTKKTLNYIKESYKIFLKINQKIEFYTKTYIKQNKNIILFGEDDEIMEIIENYFKTRKLNYIKINNIELISVKSNGIIYLWDIELEEKIAKYNLRYINIIKEN